MSVYLRDEANHKFYRLVNVSRAWLKEHDNGAMISCGLSVGETVTAASLKALIRMGKAVEVSEDDWKHSGCQSRCIRRGDEKCQW